MKRPLLDNWHTAGPLLIWLGSRRPFVRVQRRQGAVGQVIYRVFFYVCMVPFLWLVVMSALDRLVPSSLPNELIFPIILLALGVAVIIARRLERVLIVKLGRPPSNQSAISGHFSQGPRGWHCEYCGKLTTMRHERCQQLKAPRSPL